MISKEVVEKVAKLSRLNLDENEITLYADQLSQILDTMAGLQQMIRRVSRRWPMCCPLKMCCGRMR